MDDPQSARTTSWEDDSDSEKRNATREKAPAIILFKSKKLLWATFVLIFCTRISLVLVDGVVFRAFMVSLTPHLKSDFSGSARSVLSVLPTVIGISSGVLRLPMAKLINKSRGVGFSLAWVASQLSLVILVYAPSLSGTVAGYMLYEVSSSGMDFVLTVILADMTSLKNRGLIYGIYATPLILKYLATPRLAQLLEQQTTDRDAFGVCAAAICLSSFILNILFSHGQAKLWDKDEQRDTTATTEERPTLLDRSWRFLIELDIPGITLAIAGICLPLLAATHFPGTKDGWSAGIFSAALVLGLISMTSLFVWGFSLAPTTYFLRSLVRDWNLVHGCVMVMLTAASIKCCTFYVSWYLQVAEDRTVVAAYGVVAMRTLAFACSAPLIGLFVQQTGNFKYPAVSAAVSLVILTSVLTFTFHQKGAWACFQICMGVAESALLLCSQMAIMSWIDHQNVAMALGIWGTFLSIAVAISSTGARVVWRDVLPQILEITLPADSKDLASELLGSLAKQKQYPMGSPIRDALVAAYGAAQKYLLCTATCIAVLALVFALLLRNINLRERRDVQGARAKGVVW